MQHVRAAPIVFVFENRLVIPKTFSQNLQLFELGTMLQVLSYILKFLSFFVALAQHFTIVDTLYFECSISFRIVVEMSLLKLFNKADKLMNRYEMCDNDYYKLL